MAALFLIGAALLLPIVIQWAALKCFRGGVSSGMSKRAVAFCVLTYTQILLGATSLSPSLNEPGNWWWAEIFSLLHILGAYAVALAGAWIWAKAHAMKGYSRSSAVLVALLTILSVALGLAAKVESASFLSALHMMAAAALLCAAVWHAYEMRIYQVG